MDVVLELLILLLNSYFPISQFKGKLTDVWDLGVEIRKTKHRFHFGPPQNMRQSARFGTICTI